MTEPGKKLKLYRLANNYSQEMLASRVGVNRSTIASYETGRRKISYDKAKQFARIFHIKCEDLLEDTTDKTDSLYTFYATNLDKKTYLTFVTIYNNLYKNK